MDEPSSSEPSLPAVQTERPVCGRFFLGREKRVVLSATTSESDTKCDTLPANDGSLLAVPWVRTDLGGALDGPATSSPPPPPPARRPPPPRRGSLPPRRLPPRGLPPPLLTGSWTSGAGCGSSGTAWATRTRARINKIGVVTVSGWNPTFNHGLLGRRLTKVWNRRPVFVTTLGALLHNGLNQRQGSLMHRRPSTGT